MGHKSLVGGTSYDISCGRTIIDGTGYDISGGKTFVSGAGYDILFKKELIIFDGGTDLKAGSFMAGYQGTNTSTSEGGTAKITNGSIVISGSHYYSPTVVPGVGAIPGYAGVRNLVRISDIDLTEWSTLYVQCVSGSDWSNMYCQIVLGSHNEGYSLNYTNTVINTNGVAKLDVSEWTSPYYFDLLTYPQIATQYSYDQTVRYLYITKIWLE